MRISDRRGYVAETYVRRDFAAAGIGQEFVQDNHSNSRTAGTVRGLHFQTSPLAQAKLIRVLRGRIFDVCIDLRRPSRYGNHSVAGACGGIWPSDSCAGRFHPRILHA
jgi:dTDP-4-dehydrorhamnose 3,5-epimerase